jgi:glycosyltransferase involved in cell wall biosynthesis
VPRVTRIQILKQWPVTAANGGEIALLERARYFRARGVEVSLHVCMPREAEHRVRGLLGSFPRVRMTSAADYEIMGLPVKLHFRDIAELQRGDSFHRLIEDEQPDLVWTHYTDFLPTFAALRSISAEKIWVDQTDNEYPRLSQLHPAVRPHYERIRMLTVASPFMQRQCGSDFPLAERLDCPNLIEDYELEDDRRPGFDASGAWVFVNPVPEKGAEFALRLAQAMPDERFEFIGNWGNDRPDRLSSNVSFRKRAATLKDVLRDARGLLMPSVWQEAFGRVALEAMCLGVPVIGSDRGNLPETISDGGLSLPLDLDHWRSAMARSEPEFQQQVERGFERFRRYKAHVAECYEKLCARLDL